MYLEDIIKYRDEINPCLAKLSIETEVDETSRTIVVATKETYIFEDEEDADRIINEARQYPGFMEAKKKFKQGKINKNGEIVKPDTYSVVIKLGH